MKPETLVQALEDVARRLGARVRRERGPFRGGLCRVGGRPVVVLNRLHPPEAQLAALAEALRALPVDTVYLRPAVRAALEDLWAAADAGSLDGGPSPAETDPGG